jgi:hypothetical protein
MSICSECMVMVAFHMEGMSRNFSVERIYCLSFTRVSTDYGVIMIVMIMK